MKINTRTALALAIGAVLAVLNTVPVFAASGVIWGS
jgi:hypothetical protein